MTGLAARKAIAALPPLTDQKYTERFTRPYEAGAHYQMPRGRAANEARVAANDNQSKHDWPVRDEAMASTLMKGMDAAETTFLNCHAYSILREVRGFLDAASPPSDWCSHNATGVIDDGEPYGTGFGADVKRDYGPSEEHLKMLWESGAEPSADGEPWNAGPCELKNVPDDKLPALGKQVKALWQVGDIRFNDRGHLGRFQDGKKRWLRFIEKTRGSKGKRRQRPSAPDPVDLLRYTGAAIPRKDNGEILVEFLAGKADSSNPETAPNTSAYSETPGGKDSSNRGEQSVFDPTAVLEARNRADDFATEELSKLRCLLGRRLYNALVDAASGQRLDEIGGNRGDKRSSAVGRNMVQIAIERIIEARGT